ncbi:MAG TPA: DUF3696 domain-containing protein [Flavobacteriia bacterium]|nr:DUF3696 domain-containing protein [Flavobacteriia bacterium]
MKINNVKIKNFKSLRDINIQLNNLTLITGVNSSGKSSFIQALLFLKENEDNLALFGRFNSLKKPLTINGKYIELGNKKDILYEEAYEENIQIALFSQDSLIIDVQFNNQDLKIDSQTNVPFVLDGEVYVICNIFAHDFQYIMTDRAIPSITYGLSDESLGQNLIGFKGEFSAHYLAENRHKALNIEALRHQDSQTKQLLENVSLWLGEISRGIEISATVYNELQQVNLTYSYVYGDKQTDKYTPLNVGFGITYVLPIIVAILKAKPNDLLIIENPESHLHPAGQSKIAELCAIASANGVQIIVETHSDHFLNGIRVATKKGLLTPEQSSIYYFRKEKDELETKIDEININKDGGIDNYPKGFFDQFDDDLDELLGL